MTAQSRTKAQLLTEVAALQQRVAELETAVQQTADRRLQALIESSQDNIALLDAQGVLLWESPAIIRALDYAPDEFVGRNVLSLIHPEDSEWVTRRLAELAHTPGDRQRAIFRLRHHDGTWRWVEAIATNLLTDPAIHAIVLNYRDITQRKQAEEIAQASEQKFRAIVEQSLVGITLLDEGGRVIEWNRANEQITGLNQADVLGQFYWDVLQQIAPVERRSPQMREHIRTLVMTALQTGESYLFEKPIERAIFAHPQHEPRYVQQTIFPIQTPQGFRAAALTQDITVRKLMEEQLRDNEQRFRMLLDNVSNIAVQGYGPDGTVRLWNKASEQLYGYSVDEAIGRNLIDLIIPAEMKPAVQVAVQQMIEIGIGQPAEELLLQRKDGSRVAVYSNHTVVHTQGHGTELYCVDIDLTERKQAEAALLASEARFRSYIEHAPLGIFVIDNDGRFVEMNSAMTDALGYSETDLVGTAIVNILPPPFRPLGQQLFEQALAAGTITGELPVYRKDGSVRWIGARGVKLDSAHFIAFCQDITDRKLAADKIQAALEEKETLLHEVHHRVKNNLQAIISLIDLQAGQMEQAEPRLFLKELGGQARTMSLVYEQLYQSENLARVAMQPYMQQLVGNVREAFGGLWRIHFDLDVSPLSLDVAQAMPCGLIVNELVTNSLKHAFPPGFSDQPRVQISLQPSGTTCRLIVGDNGVGLPPDGQVQAHQSLGLHLIKLWVTHQLGGTLEVRQVPGVTYTICFTAQGG